MADGEDEIGDERYESLFFSNLLIRCSTNHDKAISTSTQDAWNSYCILYQQPPIILRIRFASKKSKP